MARVRFTRQYAYHGRACEYYASVADHSQDPRIPVVRVYEKTLWFAWDEDREYREIRFRYHGKERRLTKRRISRLERMREKMSDCLLEVIE